MAPSKPIRGVIYDMDGLLLDTEPFYTVVSQHIASRFGKTFDWSVKSRMIGQKSSDSARVFVEALQLPMTPAQYLQERTKMLDELFPQAEPMPGAVRLTRHLHRHRVPQAVGTSSNGHHFELKISRHKDWWRIFDCCVIGDDPAVVHGKPAPDIFLIAAERLGVSPEDCLVFEDAPAGVAAARAAGMCVVAVPDPNMDVSVCEDADQVLRSLTEFEPNAWGLPAWNCY